MIVTVTLNPSLDEWMELPALRVGVLNRAGGFARYPGGKGLNVSRVVHELGSSTLAMGVAGGEDGLILRELINRLGIPHDFVPIPGGTRNNYKIRTVRPRALTEINTVGPRVSNAALSTLFAHLRRRRASCVAFCGSLPPGVPPTIYRAWIQRLRRAGVFTALDSSGEALRAGLRGRPWLVKPNRQEAEELFGRRLRRLHDVIEAARALLRRGASCAILSMGKDGAVLATARPARVWRAVPPAINVASAVGAGDSLVGGFLVGWTQGRDAADALRLGVACGVASAMTPGTELCRRADVRRLLPRVKLLRIF